LREKERCTGRDELRSFAKAVVNVPEHEGRAGEKEVLAGKMYEAKGIESRAILKTTNCQSRGGSPLSIERKRLRRKVEQEASRREASANKKTTGKTMGLPARRGFLGE